MKRITHILLCYRRRRRLDLHREFRENLGRRFPICNRARCAPHPYTSSPPPRLCPFSQHPPLFCSGPLVLNKHACYFVACVWYRYGGGGGGGLEVGDGAGEY